jgi:hypothetical protein
MLVEEERAIAAHELSLRCRQPCLQDVRFGKKKRFTLEGS